MYKIILSLLLFSSAYTLAQEPYQYIFFYKDDTEKKEKYESVFDEAMSELGDRAEAIKVQVKDPSQMHLVEKYNLKRAPMPFVIVTAPNGAVMGGWPLFTKEQLTGAISTQCAECCLKALQDKKLVLLMLQNGNTKNNEAALQGAYAFQADPSYRGAVEVVVVDPALASEQPFLSQLGVDGSISEATTLLITPPATVVGTYKGAVSKEKLAGDLKAASSGCCPGGCCPGGCCK